MYIRASSTFLSSYSKSTNPDRVNKCTRKFHRSLHTKEKETSLTTKHHHHHHLSGMLVVWLSPRGGTEQWPPLFTRCCSRYPGKRVEESAASATKFLVSRLDCWSTRLRTPPERANLKCPASMTITLLVWSKVILIHDILHPLDGIQRFTWRAWVLSRHEFSLLSCEEITLRSKHEISLWPGNKTNSTKKVLNIEVSIFPKRVPPRARWQYLPYLFWSNFKPKKMWQMSSHCLDFVRVIYSNPRRLGPMYYEEWKHRY